MSSYYNRSLQILTDTDTHISLLAVFYILLVGNVLDYETLIKTLILLSTIAIYLSYTFFINDFFDMSYDMAAGKKRLVHDLPRTYSIGIMFLMFIISFSIVIFIINDLLYGVLYFVTYFMGTFYSAPPLRFKDKGVLGILADILIERTLPMLLVLTFFRHFELDTILLLFAFSILQLDLILEHQVLDCSADLKTGINTFVTTLGYTKALNLLNNYMRPLAALAIFSACIGFVYMLEYRGIPVFLMLLGYIPAMYLFKWGILKQSDTDMPFYLKYIFEISTILVPLYMATLLFIQSRLFIVLLFLFIISISPHMNKLRGNLFCKF